MRAIAVGQSPSILSVSGFELGVRGFLPLGAFFMFSALHWLLIQSLSHSAIWCGLNLRCGLLKNARGERQRRAVDWESALALPVYGVLDSYTHATRS